MFRGKAPLHVIEGPFLVDINEDASIDRVGQDNRRPNVVQLRQDLQRGWKQSTGERIVDEVGRHRQKLYFTGMLGAKALQGSQIVAVAKFGKEILQELPIAIAGVAPVGAFKVILQILLYAIIVEQRVVNIDQEDDRL